jgi:hypothetical protein
MIDDTTPPHDALRSIAADLCQDIFWALRCGTVDGRRLDTDEMMTYAARALEEAAETDPGRVVQ